MGIGIWALLVFIGIIIFWNLVLKRNIAEAMLAGFLATSMFGGTQFFDLIWSGLLFAGTNDVLYASVAFVFMAYVIDHTAIIASLVKILNSLLGRLPGGAAYVDTIASAVMGTLAGSNSGNTATTGSITAPWMVQSDFTRERAATIVAGNGGLGAALPPSASMFIMLGFAPIAAVVSEGDLYVALFISGIYQVIYRVFLIMYFVKRDNIKAISPEFIQPLKEALRTGWKSTLIFFGALIPIVVTIGPIAERFMENPNIGEDAMDSISLITWIPILIILISMMVGWTRLPKTAAGWSDFLNKAIPRFSTIGALLVFAYASSQVLTDLGLPEDLTAVMESISISKWLMVLFISLLVALVAGPLSSTATLTAIGMVAFAAMVSAGVDPLLAVVAILVFASTEGASPPASGSIFIAASLAGASPEKTFVPLVVYYVVPILLIGYLIAMGFLPVLM
ncbi:C4-dicarboxylate ABC transporter permease [Bacillus sp. SA1-12]|uniref:TRAP transporter large permease subunit n=1 Tax=Bacillus sp. SA1-12 TaxID=1455638 RepID=UPI00062714E9|nr:TRAP transporter large permease subunit [Bacillus sp. SA1-12]KKI89017.1 C4-dicarboxylate ABC transporter permease [Bacillus sp. SA1-12]